MQSIIISGFMGTGKSTVGRTLAARLGRGFVDLDEWIEMEAGCDISELFAREGEAAFRKLEREVLARVLAHEALVVAVGGGTLLEEEALSFARSRCVIFSLTATFDTVWSRIRESKHRPLVAEEESARALMAARASAYEKAHHVVEVDGRSPGEIADSIQSLYLAKDSESGGENIRVILRAEPGSLAIADLEVPLGDRSYSLEFAAGGRHHLGQKLRKLFPKAQKVAVLTNALVGGLYFQDLEKSLGNQGFQVLRIDVPDGETAKEFREAERVLDVLISHRFERREPLVALGGGVVGDLTGFVASILLRGVPFIQVPTTLLAQVDSSIGGKTGVNSPRGKNLIGSFYQPAHVLIDVEVLRTLEDVEFKAGLAEVIKYGAIRDLPFLRYLEAHLTDILAREGRVLEQLIHRSCTNKAEVVMADELEQGLRAQLNFGHTLGHAFETIGAYSGLKHGQAVAIGMVFAARLSRALALLEEESTVEELSSILRAFGLPIRAPKCTAEECLQVMSLDKKMRQGVVQFVLIESLGSARMVPLTSEQIRPVLREFLGNPA